VSEVSITVSGRSYRMACDDGQEEHLIGLGQRFDSAIDELRAGFGEIGDQRLTVMAAILMTDRLDEAEQKIIALEEQLASLRSASEEHDLLSVRFAKILENAAGRVESLAAALDAQHGDLEPER